MQKGTAKEVVFDLDDKDLEKIQIDEELQAIYMKYCAPNDQAEFSLQKPGDTALGM